MSVSAKSIETVEQNPLLRPHPQPHPRFDRDVRLPLHRALLSLSLGSGEPLQASIDLWALSGLLHGLAYRYMGSATGGCPIDDAGCDWTTDRAGNTFIAHERGWVASNDPVVAALIDAANIVTLGRRLDVDEYMCRSGQSGQSEQSEQSAQSALTALTVQTASQLQAENERLRDELRIVSFQSAVDRPPSERLTLIAEAARRALGNDGRGEREGEGTDA